MAERYRLTRLGAAVEQLEWAIDLLVNHNAPVAAIPLAAAAEELLGKMCSTQNAMDQLKSTLAADTGVNPDDIGKQLNETKNWLKHGAKETHDVDLECEAVQFIARALTNLRRAATLHLPMGAVFDRWIARHPELGLLEEGSSEGT